VQRNIVTCIGVTYRRVLDWMIGFIAHYTFTTRDYRQYSAIAILHTFQFTVTHPVGISVITSRILATYITVSLSLQITRGVFFAQSSSLFAIILQLPIPKTRLSSIPLFPSSCLGRLASRSSALHFSLLLASVSSRLLIASFYNPSTRTTQKAASLIEEACLLVCCLAVDVLFLHAYASRECVY
jgi:hypothetical protein